MNILDLDLALDPNIALFTAGTINFLQAAYQQGFAATIQTLIGLTYDATKVYILYGCEYTISGSGHMTSGVVFFNGEFYLSPSQTILLTSGVLVSNLTVTPYTTALGGDPMKFDNSGTITTNNVHNQRLVTYSYGTSGTGTLTGTANGDYDNFIRLETGYISTGFFYTSSGDNIWSDLGGSFYPFSFNKDKDYVTFSGAVTNSASLGSSPVFIGTLPHGFRPASDVKIVASCSNGFITLDISASTGQIGSVTTTTTAGVNVFMDNVGFRLN
jgi:hypothetical protein